MSYVSMLNTKSKTKPTRRGGDKQLSTRTKRQIASLPTHAQHIYRKTHASAIEQYQDPEKRRGGKRQSSEEVAPVKKSILKREING
jgi:cation transport regulator